MSISGTKGSRNNKQSLFSLIIASEVGIGLGAFLLSVLNCLEVLRTIKQLLLFFLEGARISDS